MDIDRQQSLLAHIDEATRLDPDEAEQIGRLAAQLHGNNILPVVGAGASYDCGMRLAREIAEDLYTAYEDLSDPMDIDPTLSKQDLAAIAEAIFLRKGQVRVVEELGIPDSTVWLSAEDLGRHFCVYCVLARMVREGFLAEAFGFNYDCGAEAGLAAEGIVTGDVKAGRNWIDRARVVADSAANSNYVKDESSFTFFKANGCAVKYRELAVNDELAAAETIIVRTDQINRWKDSGWSRTPFRGRAENHILLLIGFAAQDPKFSIELRTVLEDIYKGTSNGGSPRVVAIDYAKNPTEIEALIRAGLNGSLPAADVATRICTEGSTSTAVLLLLLAEMLEIALKDEFGQEGVDLPQDIEARLALFTVSVPTMRRWSYLMEHHDQDLIQRANQVADRGYVPLTLNRRVTARSIVARRAVRQRLGQPEVETAKEAAANHGFLVDRDQATAYMPVGIEHDALVSACRSGSGLEQVKSALRGMHPERLECVLVSGDGTEMRGVNLRTGNEV